MSRLYHIVAINEKTGKKEYLTTYPMPHDDCCVMLSKQSKNEHVRKQLEGVEYHKDVDGALIKDENGEPIPKGYCICSAYTVLECSCGAYWEV